MSIAAPINRSAQVRELHRREPQLTPAELAQRTGVPLPNVKAALRKRDRGAPKSRRVP